MLLDDLIYYVSSEIEVRSKDYIIQVSMRILVSHVNGTIADGMSFGALKNRTFSRNCVTKYKYTETLKLVVSEILSRISLEALRMKSL